MGRVTIIFYPNDRKQSKTTKQIPIYLRVRKARVKSEADIMKIDFYTTSKVREQRSMIDK